MLINIVGVDFDSGYGASKLLACLPRLALRVFEPDPSVIIGGPKLGFLLRSTYVQQLLGTNNFRPSIALAREPVVSKQAEHANLDVRGSCTPCRGIGVEGFYSTSGLKIVADCPSTQSSSMQDVSQRPKSSCLWLMTQGLPAIPNPGKQAVSTSFADPGQK